MKRTMDMLSTVFSERNCPRTFAAIAAVLAAALVISGCALPLTAPAAAAQGAAAAAQAQVTAEDAAEAVSGQSTAGQASGAKTPLGMLFSAAGTGANGRPAAKAAAGDGAYEVSAEYECDAAVAMEACDVADDGWYEEPWAYESPDWNTEEYAYQKENSFVSAKAQPFSTFAADVDTASYSNLRRQVMDDGHVVADSVRIEELVNYFRYDYPDPAPGEPFSVTTGIAPCPWNEDTELLLVGLKARSIDSRELPRASLTFLIDVSGSMDEPNKLPLVQRSFRTLTENLREDDIVSIVTYSGEEKVVLDGVPVSRRGEILGAIGSLYAYGCTNGERALMTAYDIAEKNFIEGGSNRIIMATDGDFNVGVSSEGELTRIVKEKAKSGVFLSVLGYGMGNYKDSRLETIADNGNGNFAYIDDIAEARRVLVEEAGGTLFTVAKDVKLQVEFDPAKIKGYRLIGYENRTMSAQDFADDTKDGGEIGAGHSVTALYEIARTGSAFDIPEVTSRYGAQGAAADGAGDGAQAGGARAADAGEDELLAVNIRFKDPDGDASRLLVYPVTESMVLKEMSADMSWAAGVAQAGMLLRGSEYAGTSDWDSIRDRLRPLADDDSRDEFIWMLGRLKKADTY